MRAVLSGYYGMGNGGDEALLASLLQMLPAQVTPIVLSGDPQQTQERHGVLAYPRKNPRALLQALGQADTLIWGGGSLMQDATSALNPVYYGGLMALAQTMGLKTIAWAQGIGPLKRSANRWLTRQTFRRCTAVSVRDRAAAALLTEWGVPFTLAPDPVWALAAMPVPGLEDLPAPRVAVNLRTHALLTPERLAHLTEALVTFQKTTQTSILLLPFQPAQDLGLAQAVQAQLPGSSQILVLDHPQQWKGVFRSVEMTIAMRLHGLIMAAAEGCPCFGLSYDPKIDHLMAELGIPGWQLAAIPTDPGTIAQTWIQQYGQRVALSGDRVAALVKGALLHRDVLQVLTSHIN